MVGCHGAANPPDPDAGVAGEVEQLVDRLVHADQFSGVVLLKHHGRSIVERAYGLADRDASRANTPDTPFALGSVSKMFTGVLVAQLVEQNRVRLDATIGSLLPDFPDGPAKSQVTVHQLLTMSSGIPGRCRISGRSLEPLRSSSRRVRTGRTAIRTSSCWARSWSTGLASHSRPPPSGGCFNPLI
jgi:CubicO group peptidase (beta-lactamase class C family)